MKNRDAPTVYVIDNDCAVRDSLKELLSAEGFAPQTYASGQKFLDQFHPSGDACILLDLHLADMYGIRILETLSRRKHHLPVIVMTGGGDGATRERALDAGAAIFLEKPIDASALVNAIRTLLQ